MAQFVLVNVVVAVLMKHLEESHKQMDEDEDHEIDMEIAKEIEAEKKALIEAIERRRRETDLKVRRPLMKMASLPSNFTFYCSTMTPKQDKGEISSLSQWTNPSKNGNGMKLEHIEMGCITTNHIPQGKDKMLGKHDTQECANSGSVKDSPFSIKSSITCDSIFLNQPRHIPERMTNISNNQNYLSCRGTNGILKKSHSLRLKNSKTSLIDSFKRSSLYRKNSTNSRGSNTKKNEEEAFLVKSDDDEDITLDDINLPQHVHSKSTEAIIGLGRNNSRKKSIKSKGSTVFPTKLTFKDAEVVDSSTVQSPVTIRIDDCHSNDTFPETTFQIDHKVKQETIDHRPENLCELLNTGTSAQTVSPSKVTNNGLKHRKLSDFLDEESAPLSPGLFGVYPEFTNDVTTYDEDLNVLDEEEAHEQLSLASMESWPSASADVADTGSNVFIDPVCEQASKS